MKTITKNIVLSAMFLAIGLILPLFTAQIPQIGQMLLPMHIPVLLCGLTCGWPYGLACGILAPLTSSLITGMPGPAYLPAMVCELAAYGLISGLTARFVRTGKRPADLYIQLISAMLLGRVVYGMMNALVFQAGVYSMELFITAAFVTAAPGILIQLAILPSLVMVLEKARVVESPYAVKTA